MTVRWGVIGCGSVCEVKSVPGLRKADGSEVVVVMRRDGEKARDYAARRGVGPHDLPWRLLAEHSGGRDDDYWRRPTTWPGRRQR